MFDFFCFLVAAFSVLSRHIWREKAIAAVIEMHRAEACREDVAETHVAALVEIAALKELHTTKCRQRHAKKGPL